jgi:hypothetical protein
MKQLNTILLSLMVFASVLMFTACETSSPFEAESGDQITLEKKGGNDKGNNGQGNGNSGNSQIKYPLDGEVKLKYDHFEEGYRAGNIRLKDGSQLHIKGETLTPPDGWIIPKPVDISMRVELDEQNDELIFTFGPSGCSFSQPATIVMYYGILGNETPKLFYIHKDGSYEEQNPDNVDRRGCKLYLDVDHFSRYAVAYGR